MYAQAVNYMGLPHVTSSMVNSPVKFYEEPVENTQVEWSTVRGPTSDPKIWGPAFWFTLHTAAAHYPIEASPIVRERMKARILAIPYEVPCSVCRPHAIDFVESKRGELDRIVSGRHELGKFYVDFHNKVNKRYGKPEWTYEQAYAKYSGNAEIVRMKY